MTDTGLNYNFFAVNNRATFNACVHLRFSSLLSCHCLNENLSISLFTVCFAFSFFPCSLIVLIDVGPIQSMACLSLVSLSMRETCSFDFEVNYFLHGFAIFLFTS